MCSLIPQMHAGSDFQTLMRCSLTGMEHLPGSDAPQGLKEMPVSMVINETWPVQMFLASNY